MSNDTQLVSRRTALKGIAAFAGTSAVGAGSILYASEPAAALGHQLPIDDITIETSTGEITEIGLSDIWFEITYENIPHDFMVRFRFYNDNGNVTSAGTAVLGLSGDGAETFGDGQAYADKYDTSLDGLPSGPNFDGKENFETPIHTTEESLLQDYSLADGEDQKSVGSGFQVNMYSKSSAEADSRLWNSWDSLETSNSDFDVTIQRVSSTGDVSDGEGDAYGED